MDSEQAEGGWEIIYVLPNLVLPPDPADEQHGQWPQGLELGTHLVAIVPPTDRRAIHALARSNGAQRALTSFRDSSGLPYAPAVLMVKSSAPEYVRREALVAFRNSVALSFILKARAGWIGGNTGSGPAFSDSFRFHPVRMGKDWLAMDSPALRELLDTQKSLVLTHSTSVPLEGKRLFPDNYLYRALGIEWRRAFTSGETSPASCISLFRSIEMAFAACGVGDWNEASIHDAGIQISLWISAIEILAWPERRHADRNAALALLAKYPLPAALAQHRFVVNKNELSALGMACWHLYDARNDFLHGNPVDLNALFGMGAGDSVSLVRIAAVVYRMALAAYLQGDHPCLGADPDDEEGAFVGMSTELDFLTALAESFGISE